MVFRNGRPKIDNRLDLVTGLRNASNYEGLSVPGFLCGLPLPGTRLAPRFHIVNAAMNFDGEPSHKGLGEFHVHTQRLSD